jgi:hypothetical protein
MRERKYKREIKRMQHMQLAELRKHAARNKRLLRNALACRFRKAYAQRKQLAQLYGRAIARRMRQV